VAGWRVAAAAAIAGVLVYLMANFIPIYTRNLQMQSFVSGLTHQAANPAQTDEVVRAAVRHEAESLQLPITEENVQVIRSAKGEVEKIVVRYFVRVTLPGYTVDLHFHPSSTR
jgi:hypothetical protein